VHSNRTSCFLYHWYSSLYDQVETSNKITCFGFLWPYCSQNNWVRTNVEFDGADDPFLVVHVRFERCRLKPGDWPWFHKEKVFSWITFAWKYENNWNECTYKPLQLQANVDFNCQVKFLRSPSFQSLLLKVGTNSRCLGLRTRLHRVKHTVDLNSTAKITFKKSFQIKFVN